MVFQKKHGRGFLNETAIHVKCAAVRLVIQIRWAGNAPFASALGTFETSRKAEMTLPTIYVQYAPLATKVSKTQHRQSRIVYIYFHNFGGRRLTIRMQRCNGCLVNSTLAHQKILNNSGWWNKSVLGIVGIVRETQHVLHRFTSLTAPHLISSQHAGCAAASCAAHDGRHHSALGHAAWRRGKGSCLPWAA